MDEDRREGGNQKITSTCNDFYLVINFYLQTRPSPLHIYAKEFYLLGTNGNVSFRDTPHQVQFVCEHSLHLSKMFLKCNCNEKKRFVLLSIWWTLNIMMKRLDWIELYIITTAIIYLLVSTRVYAMICQCNSYIETR